MSDELTPAPFRFRVASAPVSDGAGTTGASRTGLTLTGKRATFVKIVAWYDNEYGYTCNLMRLVQHIAK